ncbi:MAG TPA: hypothetical protein PLZ15_00490 [Melioribacteraceae bacterium]|nr:hypothetical protein [Melioribacteraceae bacterium]
MKLRLDKNINLGKSFWKKLGANIIKWVRDDFQRGIFQNNKSGLDYKSDEYKKYKANDMRRFTTGEGQTFSDKTGYFFGKTYFHNKKAKQKKGKSYTTGQRLKEYYGTSIESHQTGYVDMTLTGQLKKGLAVKDVSDNSVTLGYNSADAGKIEGNRKYGREVVGLNDNNIEKTRDMIIQEMKKNLLSGMQGDINIEIKL